MTPPQKLDISRIQSMLKELPNWKLNAKGSLERELKFKTFREAFSFMTRVAFEAEQLNHHPDWSNSYNRVRIELTTHDADGITDLDFQLAKKIEEIDWSK